MNIEYAAAQDNSRHGQDQYLVRPEIGLFAVADGVSSLSGSALAAELTLSRLEQRFRGEIDNDDFIQSRTRVTKVTSVRGASTLCALFMCDNKVQYWNVGDSKLEAYDDEKLAFVSEPHEIDDENGIPRLGAWFMLQGGMHFLETYSKIRQYPKIPKPPKRAVRTFVLSTDGIRSTRSLVSGSAHESLQSRVDALIRDESACMRDDRTVIAVRTS